MSNVVFFMERQDDPVASTAAGKPVTKPVPMVRITQPGETGHVVVMKAHSKMFDPETKVWVTPAEFYGPAYKAFHERGETTQGGTPLAAAEFISDNRRRDCERAHVYTVEALAGLDTVQGKVLGPHSDALIAEAKTFLAERAKQMSLDEQSALQARADEQAQELEALKAQMAALTAKPKTPAKAEAKAA